MRYQSSKLGSIARIGLLGALVSSPLGFASAQSTVDPEEAFLNDLSRFQAEKTVAAGDSCCKAEQKAEQIKEMDCCKKPDGDAAHSDHGKDKGKSAGHNHGDKPDRDKADRGPEGFRRLFAPPPPPNPELREAMERNRREIEEHLEALGHLMREQGRLAAEMAEQRIGPRAEEWKRFGEEARKQWGEEARERWGRFHDNAEHNREKHGDLIEKFRREFRERHDEGHERGEELREELRRRFDQSRGETEDHLDHFRHDLENRIQDRLGNLEGWLHERLRDIEHNDEDKPHRDREHADAPRPDFPPLGDLQGLLNGGIIEMAEQFLNSPEGRGAFGGLMDSARERENHIERRLENLQRENSELREALNHLRESVEQLHQKFGEKHSL